MSQNRFFGGYFVLYLAHIRFQVIASIYRCNIINHNKPILYFLAVTWRTHNTAILLLHLNAIAVDDVVKKQKRDYCNHRVRRKKAQSIGRILGFVPLLYCNNIRSTVEVIVMFLTLELLYPQWTLQINDEKFTYI